MKTFTNLINEKLKLNKDIELSNEEENTTLINNIIKYLRLSQYNDPEFIDIINDWIKDNNIKDVIFACNKETFNDIKTANGYLNKKYQISKLDINLSYNTASQAENICLKEFDNCLIVCQNKYGQDYIDILQSPNMICCIGPLGTIYCLDYNFFFNKK